MSLTTNLQLSTPAHGSEVDLWDQDVNGNSTLIDQMVGSGISTISAVAGALTNVQLQNTFLRFTGAIAGNVTMTLPASPILKPWFIENLTTGGGNFYLAISNSAGTSVVGIPLGEATHIYYDGTTMRYMNLARVGSYMDIATSAVPSWITACTVPPYLACVGGTFSAVTYPSLAQVLGTTTLPDFRGRSRSYLNQGTSRITSAGSGVNGDVITSGGGAETVTVGQANLPSVNFTGSNTITVTLGFTPVQDGGANYSVNDSGSIAVRAVSQTLPTPTASGTNSISVASGGSGTGLNNMPPTAIGGLTLIRAA